MTFEEKDEDLLRVYITKEEMELPRLKVGTKVNMIVYGANAAPKRKLKAKVIKKYENYIRFKVYARFGSINECFLRVDLVNKIDWSVI